jgi:hypothetical protein
MLGGLLCLLAGIAAAHATTTAQVRKPSGVYAKVDVEYVLLNSARLLGTAYKLSQTPTQACASIDASADLAALHTALQAFYMTLLADPALSGLSAGVYWCRVQLNNPAQICSVNGCLPDGNDWSFVDDFFAAAAAYNDQYGTSKTIQLSITPGVYSPAWLTRRLGACDALIQGTGPGDGCGKATFQLFPEQRNVGKTPAQLPLPVPWSTDYITHWTWFLTDLAGRYASRSELVSIAIAGPNCASSEMILPSDNKQSAYSATISADAAWATMIADHFGKSHRYAEHPEQVFVAYWEQAIDFYERTFPYITLVLLPDDSLGMPQIGDLLADKPAAPLTRADCHATVSQDSVSCSAKVQVIQYFQYHSLSPAIDAVIGKATSVGGMAASSPVATGKIDLPGVKLLTGYMPPAGTPPPPVPLLGGAEFDHAVSVPGFLQQEGCRVKGANCKISVVEAAYNVFANYFHGTSAGQFFGDKSVPTGAPVQFVDVVVDDVVYALAPENQCGSGKLGTMSLQDMFNWANYGLAWIATAPDLARPTPTCLPPG